MNWKNERKMGFLTWGEGLWILSYSIEEELELCELVEEEEEEEELCVFNGLTGWNRDRKGHDIREYYGYATLYR